MRVRELPRDDIAFPLRGERGYYLIVPKTSRWKRVTRVLGEFGMTLGVTRVRGRVDRVITRVASSKVTR